MGPRSKGSRIRGDVVGIGLRLDDPEAGARFLVDHLGFLVVDSAEGRRLLANGALRVGLMPQPPGAEEVSGVWLEVETTDLAATCTGLAETGCLRTFEAKDRAGADRLERRLVTVHGLRLLVVQPLTEDDRDELAPLPASLDWQPQADLLVRRVLRTVPLTFRDGARRRATERAEAVALVAGAQCIETHHAIEGLYAATPEVQHAALADALATLSDETCR